MTVSMLVDFNTLDIAPLTISGDFPLFEMGTTSPKEWVPVCQQFKIETLDISHSVSSLSGFKEMRTSSSQFYTL